MSCLEDVPEDGEGDSSPLLLRLSAEAEDRGASMKEGEHEGDVESEGDDGEERAGSSTKRRVRRRRRSSRTSRPDSASEERSSPCQPNSQEEDGDGDGEEASSSSTASDFEEDPSLSRKPRPAMRRRVRQPDEFERVTREKVSAIDRALTMAPEEGLDRLRDLATSEDGLLDDELRRRAWPRLANVPRMVESEVLPSQKECEAHPEYNQVVMDVARSLKRFPPGIKEADRPGLQDQLTRLIVRVLLKHGPSIHYYQGYHDVAITFLLVVGEEMGYHIMQRLTLSHLREFMAPTMERTTFLLNYIYPLLERENPELHDFLESSEVGTIFALPWLITWFGHVLPDYEDVVRLYDFFLAQPPLMPVYLAAALVLHRDQEVLLCECDMAMVHGLLSRIPTDIPFEKLLVDAQELYDSYPPKTLEGEVGDRFERLKEEYKLRGRTARDVTASGLSLYTTPAVMVAGAVVVGAPVLIGVAVWKWLNSS